ncbi:hypothetical protein KKF64_02825 [Patescibacteria group bacterium]|nr:hypothetical protein [Patescibacteria group bacterium]
MLGFGKKPAQKAENKQDNKNTPNTAPVPVIDISDDKFTVMPKQYLPQKGKFSKAPASISAGPGQGINKKFLILGGAALLILIIISAILYFVFFFSGDTSAPVAIAPEEAQVKTDSPAKDITTGAAEPEIKEKIITSQAYDDSNVLIGSINITIPATVVQEFGTGIGITVLAPEDLSLPEDITILGGLYSVYPSGVSFDEPLSIEIIVSDVPQGVSQSDVYPAYLRGVKWQEFDDYQAPASVTGFILTLEKFPTGPIAVIWSPEEEDDDTGSFDFIKAVPSIDTDSDGLTDTEEGMIGTSYLSVDSDEDTYQDLDEILNGYNPLVGGGSRLEESGIFATYTNLTYGYHATYPAQWLADSLDQTNKQVLFISETEEFFEILIEENPLNTPIVDWYRAQSPSLKNVELDVTVIDKRPAVWSVDGLTLYASKDGLIYILTYNRGTRDEISWPNMFEYFYNSFVFGNTFNDAGTATTTPEGI